MKTIGTGYTRSERSGAQCRCSAMTISLDTIGALIDNSHNLRAYCNAPKCHHCVKLDLVALAAKLGRNHSSMHKDLVPKLYCSKCKSKDIALILSTESTEGMSHV